MNNGASITEKIIGDAAEKAGENINAAKEKAAKIVERAEKSAAVELDKLKSELPALEKEIVSRRETVAKIDAKKVLLNKKTEAIDGVFAAAEEYIASDKRYKPWLLRLLSEYAEDGDRVAVGELDAAIITAKDVAQAAASKKIKLSLSDEKPDFGRGIMLIGENADKNLTLTGIIRQRRDELAAAVTAELFAEQ